MRIDVRKVELIKALGNEFVGSRTRAKIVKNKVAPPFKEAEFDIMYGEGISRTAEIVDLGVKLDIIHKSGAWFSYGEERLGQGKDNVKKLLKSNPALLEEITEKVKKEMPALYGFVPKDKDKKDEAKDSSAKAAAKEPEKKAKSTLSGKKLDIIFDED